MTGGALCTHGRGDIATNDVKEQLAERCFTFKIIAEPKIYIFNAVRKQYFDFLRSERLTFNWLWEIFWYLHNFIDLNIWRYIFWHKSCLLSICSVFMWTRITKNKKGRHVSCKMLDAGRVFLRQTSGVWETYRLIELFCLQDVWFLERSGRLFHAYYQFHFLRWCRWRDLFVMCSSAPCGRSECPA